MLINPASYEAVEDQHRHKFNMQCISELPHRAPTQLVPCTLCKMRSLKLDSLEERSSEHTQN